MPIDLSGLPDKSTPSDSPNLDMSGLPDSWASQAHSQYQQNQSLAPDTVAKVVNLQRKTGLPPQTILNNQDAASTKANEPDWVGLDQHARKTLKAMASSPYLLNVAKDDTGNQARFERALNHPSLQPWHPSLVHQVLQHVDQFFGAGDRAKARAANTMAEQATGMTPEQATQAVGGLNHTVNDIGQQLGQGLADAVTLGLAPDMNGQAQTTEGSIARGVGNLLGFVAAPMRAGEALTTKLGERLAINPETDTKLAALLKSSGRQAATLGAAGGLAATGTAARQDSVGDALKTYAEATAQNAAIGGVFGTASQLFPKKSLSHFAGRWLLNSVGANAMQGTTPWDNRPLEQKVFDAGLNAFFSLHPGTEVATNRWLGKALKAEKAKQTGPQIAEMADAAQKSKVAERDPEAFAQLVKAAAEDGPAENVYIPVDQFAQHFLQGGKNPEDTLFNMPEVVKSYREALANGTDVRIPTDTFLTHIARDLQNTPLLDHVKFNPEDMTAAEAKDWQEHAGEELKADLEQTAKEQTQAQQLRESGQKVRDQIKQQLDDAKRFTPDVNNAYATLAAEHYKTVADRHGITPEEAFKRYPLDVTADGLPGESVLNQGSDKLPPEEAAAKLGIDVKELTGDEYEKAAELFRRLGRSKAGAEKRDVVGSTVAGDRPNPAWTRESHIRTASGDPATVYRGSEKPLTAGDFKPEALGKNTGNPTSGLGVWFTESGDDAAKYGKHVAAYHLDIRNPAVFTIGGGKDLPEFQSTEAAHKFREKLRKQGHDGIEIDMTPVGGVKHFIAFDPHQAIHPDKAFYQATRGAYSPDTHTITLLKDADLSTFLHEFGHFQLEHLAHLANREGAPDQVKHDMNTVLQWFGVDSLDQWNKMTLEEKRQHHEQFAEGFEKYLFEGKAPSHALKEVFNRFRAWLMNVYHSLRNLNVPLTDEVRGVMDRLLATEDGIQATQAEQAYRPLFESADEAGMDSETWQRYVDEQQAATNQAMTDLETRSLRDMQWLTNAKSKALRKLQRDAADKRKEVRKEVAAQVDDTPTYKAMRFLKRGEITDENGELQTHDQHRLDIDALEARYQGEADAPDWRKLGYGKYGMLGKEGLDPEITAEQLGFSSADEMVRTLLDAPSRRAEIEARTDQAMLERYGDITDPETMQRAAEAAIHNRAREKVLATEANALAKALGQRSVLLKAVRQYATEAIAKQTVRDAVKPARYATAEAKAGREADKARKQGRTEDAARHKREQLLNAALYRAASDAQAEVDKGIRYVRRSSTAGSRANKRGDFLIQREALLARFDFRTSLTKQELDQRQGLRQFIEDKSNELSAVLPEIPDKFLDDAFRTHYTELTLDEFRGLIDSVRQLDKLARREQQMYQAEKDMTFQQESDAILAEMRGAWSGAFDDEGKPLPPDKSYAPGAAEKLKQSAQWLNGELMNAENILQVLSGGKLGQLHDSIFERMSRRNTWKIEKLKEIKAYIDPYMQEYSLLERRQFGKKGYFIPEIGRSLTKENMVATALYYGNPEGRQRLRDGNGWSDAQVKAILDHLDERDFNMVKAWWHLFDHKIWPELAALNERTRGIAPPKVEPAPYLTKFGEMPGGYVRLKYDTDLSEKAQRLDAAAATKDMFQGKMGAPKTRQGSSTERVETVNRALDLSFSNLGEAVNESVHDIAYREAVADVNRLLKAKPIEHAIKSIGGKHTYRALTNWLGEVAAPSYNPSEFFEKMLSWGRHRATVMMMGFSAQTALFNIANVPAILARVRPGHFAKGTMEFYSNPKERWDFIAGHSDFMKRRLDNFERDVQEEARKFSAKGRLLPEYDGWFRLIGWTDLGIAAPTWLAAFHDAMAKHGNDAERAVKYADHIVRQTQGSGRAVDLSQIQRGGPLKKAWTMFYSFFNSQYSLLVRSGVLNAKDYGDGNRARAVGNFTAHFMAIVVLPAVLGDVAMGRCKGMDSVGGWADCVGHATAGYLSSFVPFLRDVGPYMYDSLDPNYKAYPLEFVPGMNSYKAVAGLPKAIKDEATGQGTPADVRNVIKGTSALFGLPSSQIIRTVEGWEAWHEGKAGPEALLFGPPKNP